VGVGFLPMQAALGAWVFVPFGLVLVVAFVFSLVFLPEVREVSERGVREVSERCQRGVRERCQRRCQRGVRGVREVSERCPRGVREVS
jgi:hypothetical protein